MTDATCGGGIFSGSLSNGIRVYVRRDPGSEIANVQAGVLTGSIHEGVYLGRGVSHYLEHLLFQGCAGFPGDAATRRINAAGGSFDAYTSYTHTVYHTSLPAEDAAAAYDVLCAMMRSPELPEAKFHSEREVILRERDMRSDWPGSVAFEAMMLGMFRRHPVRHPIIGYRELIAGVTREMLFDYHRRRYVPERIFFVVNGPECGERVVEALEGRIGDLPRAFLAEEALPEEPPPGAFAAAELTFPDPLARLALGFRLPVAADPATPAAELLAGLIGQNPSSPLQYALCRREELATELESFAFSGACPGVFGISATVRPELAGRLTECLFDELEKLRHCPFTREELRLEQLRRITDDRRSLKTGRDWANYLTESIVAVGAPRLPEEFHRKIMAVTPEEIGAFAAGLFERSAATLVTMLPERRAGGKARRRRAAAPEAECRADWCRARVVEYPAPASGMIELTALLPGGLIRENPRDNGISQLLAAAWDTGAGSKREEQWHQWIDRHAIEIGVSGGNNSLHLRLSAPVESEREAWEAWRRLLAAPRFDPKPVKRERANVIAMLESRAASPTRVEEEARRLLFGAHPYGMPLGDAERVAALTPGDLRECYRRLWHPGQVVFGVAGSYDRDRARRSLEALDRELAWLAAPPAAWPQPHFIDRDRRGTVALDREQCLVVAALPGIAEADADRDCLTVLLRLENGLAAHLFRVVREERSLAYSVSMGAVTGFVPGCIYMGAGCEYRQAEEVARLLNAEPGYLAGGGPGPDEFDGARRAAVVQLARWRENPSEWLQHAVFTVYYGGEPDAFARQRDRLAGLGLEEFRAFLARRFAGAPTATVLSTRP